MFTRKFVRTVILASLAISLSSLSTVPESRSRIVACLPEEGPRLFGGFSSGPAPLSNDLIGQIRDEGIRQSARDWYYYLTQVELRSLSQYQNIRAGYGLKTSLYASADDYRVTVAPFQLTPIYGASGTIFSPLAGFGGFTPPLATLNGVAVAPSAPGARPVVSFASPAQRGGVISVPAN